MPATGPARPKRSCGLPRSRRECRSPMSARARAIIPFACRRSSAARGRVLAQDIVPETRDRLAQRVQRENLDNVAVSLGSRPTRCFPPHSFDRIFLVHMYHEVTQPYEFLWHLREGLKPGGLVIVVDCQPSGEAPRHAAPATDVRICGARPGAGKDRRLAGSDAYFAAFRVASPRPRPHDIRPARSQVQRAKQNSRRRHRLAKAAPSAACCCIRSPAKIR